MGTGLLYFASTGIKFPDLYTFYYLIIFLYTFTLCEMIKNHVKI